MKLAVIGLGRMGGNIVRRLLRGGHQCVIYDANPATASPLQAEGAMPIAALDDLRLALSEPPRIVWLMLPAGAVTEQVLAALTPTLSAGDIVIDGGNGFYRDDQRRAQSLQASGIHYVDVGTSGGIWGLERGYCLMIGGEKTVVDYLDPIFRTLAPGAADVEPTPGWHNDDRRPLQGYAHVGGVGAGHYVKMVHNGIEYGLMQAYAEGFALLKSQAESFAAGTGGFELPLADIAEVWRHGSVITSWLLDLSANALIADTELKHYSGYVDDSGEGRWTLASAVEEGVPVPVLSAALFARFSSRDEGRFADKLLSALRSGFGGHPEAPSSRHG